jgi:hypothetical protein
MKGTPILIQGQQYGAMPNAKFYQFVGRCDDFKNITNNPNCASNAYVEAEMD